MTRRTLGQMFRRERQKFARVAPDVARARLGIDDRQHSPGSNKTARDLAWADLETQTVWLVARALKLPRRNLLAIVRHELGHLADDVPNQPGAEARADRIAFEVTGQRIRYDERDLQSIGRGSFRRPAHLHQ